MRAEDKISSTDDFWDIEDLMPRRKQKAVFSRDTDTVELNIDGTEAEEGEKIPERTPNASAGGMSERLRLARLAMDNANEKYRREMIMKKPERYGYSDTVSRVNANDRGQINRTAEAEYSYIPERNRLIEEVTVCRWAAPYTFYERFRSDAERLYGKEGSECDEVEYYSMIPQYIQLNDKQMKYYLYFRTKAGRQEYIKADYSYILLYIYEIINLPDRIKPEYGAAEMARIVRHYGRIYPQLIEKAAVWLCDYCMINRLGLPAEADEIADELYLHAPPALKDFYIGEERNGYSAYAYLIYNFAKKYNYGGSRFATEENRKLFDRYIPESVISALDGVEKSGAKLSVPVGEKATKTRTARHETFYGAVCVYSVKRVLLIKYRECRYSQEIRYIVTDAIKYSENKIRRILGIRNRLHTPYLPDEIKKEIDRYYLTNVKEYRKNPAKKPTEPVPEYDKLYEPENAEFSPGRAREIERSGWATTAMLTEDTDETGDPVEKLTEEAYADTKVSPDREVRYENGGAETAVGEELIREVLEAVGKCGGTGVGAIAKRKKMMPETLIETVNEYFYDIIGDSIITDSGGVYAIAEEYAEDIEKWKKETK